MESAGVSSKRVDLHTEVLAQLAQMNDDIISALIGAYAEMGASEEQLAANPSIQMFRAWQDQCQALIRALGHEAETVRRVPVNPRIPTSGVHA